VSEREKMRRGEEEERGLDPGIIWQVGRDRATLEHEVPPKPNNNAQPNESPMCEYENSSMASCAEDGEWEECVVSPSHPRPAIHMQHSPPPPATPSTAVTSARPFRWRALLPLGGKRNGS